MKIKVVKKVDKLPAMQAALENIDGTRVQVGVTGEHARLAGIHEYGMHITAKAAGCLTVPVHPDAVDKKAGDIPGLFKMKSKNGNLFLVKKKGKDIVPYYWLTKSVNIPERSFLRAGFDESADKIVEMAKSAIPLVLNGRLNERDMLESIAVMLHSAVKNRAETLKDPPKSKITKACYPNKGNPLAQTGDMIGGIEAVVIKS